MANANVKNFAGLSKFLKSSGAGSDADPFIIEHLDTNSAAIKTALELIDDTVYTDDTSTHATGTSKGIGIMAAATPTDGSVEANDIGMVGMSLDRRLYVDAQIVGTDAALDVSGATVTVDGSGVTQPVSGTVTANLSATDNAVLDTIDAVLDTIFTELQGKADLGETQPVSLASVPSHAVTNAGTFAVQADSVIPGTGATNLGKAIDTAAGATDTGIAPLAIRDDSLSALTPIEGDYVPLRVNSTGALHVTGSSGVTEFAEDTAHNTGDAGIQMLVVRNDAGGALAGTTGDYTPLQVDSVGALRVTGGGGGTEYNEDVATPATIVGTATLIERDDALTTVTPIEGDWIGLRGTAEGALWTQDFNSDALLTELQGKADLGETQPVSLASVPSHAVTNAGTFAVQEDGAALTALQLIDDAVFTDDTTTHTATTTKGLGIGVVAVPTDTTVEANDIAMPGMSTDRRLWTDTQIVGQDAALDVSAATLTVNSHAVTNAGTFAVQVDGAALTALQLIDNSIATHDATAAGSITQLGLEGRNTEPTAVGTTGDGTRALASMLGKQVIVPYAIPASTWSYAGPASGITDTTNDVLKAAGAAGVRNYVTSVQVINAHATVDTEVVIKDGSTVIHRGWAGADGGGYAAKFDPPLRGTAATAMNVAAITTGTATHVSAQGYQAAE